MSTILRYFEDWKKPPKNFSSDYKRRRKKIKSDTEFSNKLVQELAENLDITQEEVILRLQKPCAIAQLLNGKLVIRIQKENQTRQEHRYQAALELPQTIELSGGSPEWIKDEVVKLQNRARLITKSAI